MDTLVKVIHPSYFNEIFSALMVCEIWFEYRPSMGDILCHDIIKSELLDILESERIPNYKYDLI